MSPTGLLKIGLLAGLSVGCDSATPRGEQRPTGAAAGLVVAAAASSAGSDRKPAAELAEQPGAATLKRVKTVFVVLLENTAWSEVEGSPDAPYLNGELLPRASVAEQYRGALGGHLHPSEPNYIWLEAGSNLGITDDANPARNHLATHAHLVRLLDEAGITWRAYQEDIPGDDCPLELVREYAPKHNPMVFFDDVTGGNDPKWRYCIEHMRPLAKTQAGSSFESDLADGKLARYNFITPNLCSDMHTSCPPIGNTIRQGDEWLAKWVPRILASDAYKNDGALFITWDEAGYAERCPTASCPIGLFVLSPLAKGGGYKSTLPRDHSSTLRTFQEIYGVRPYLGAAANAEDLADLFKP
jgi:hypothetical protein